MATIESELGNLDAAEAGVLVDLYLTWRALSNWDHMIALYEKLSHMLKRSILVREQYAFALNRAGRRGEALAALESVLSQQGPSSETLGTDGAYLQGSMDGQQTAGPGAHGARLPGQAIEVYARGFESDWRDSYPGINAVTLLDIRGDDESLRRKNELLPVVRFAVTQRLKGSKPIYWDYATLLELSALDNNEKDSFKGLSDSLAAVREAWEPQTTANNMKLIRDARQARGTVQGWLDEVIEALDRRSAITGTRGAQSPR